jgi:hypothetical protein
MRAAAVTGLIPGAAVVGVRLVDMACRIQVQPRRAGGPKLLTEGGIEAVRAAAPGFLERLWKHFRRTRVD